VGIRSWLQDHVRWGAPEVAEPQQEPRLEAQADMQMAVDRAIERSMRGLPPELVPEERIAEELFRSELEVHAARLAPLVREFEAEHGCPPWEYRAGLPEEYVEKVAAARLELEGPEAAERIAADMEVLRHYPGEPVADREELDEREARELEEPIEREPLPQVVKERDLVTEAAELDLERQQQELEADRLREVERELEGPELSH
jgi:hypothetical protein